MGAYHRPYVSNTLGNATVYLSVILHTINFILCQRPSNLVNTSSLELFNDQNKLEILINNAADEITLGARPELKEETVQ